MLTLNWPMAFSLLYMVLVNLFVATWVIRAHARVVPSRQRGLYSILIFLWPLSLFLNGYLFVQAISDFEYRAVPVYQSYSQTR